jgi:hypothetical protein
VLGVVNDFITASVPLVLLWDLQMSRRSRLRLAIALCSGYAVAACAIGKTVTSNEAATDPSYVLVAVEMWAISEENLGILVASIPGMRMVFKAVEQKMTNRFTTRDDRAGYAPTHGEGQSARLHRTYPSTRRSLRDLEHDDGSEHDLVPDLTGLHIQRTVTINIELHAVGEADAAATKDPYMLPDTPGHSVTP